MLSYWQNLASQENQNYWNQQNYDFQLRQYEDALAAKAAKGGGGGGKKKKTVELKGYVPADMAAYWAQGTTKAEATKKNAANSAKSAVTGATSKYGTNAATTTAGGKRTYSSILDELTKKK